MLAAGTNVAGYVIAGVLGEGGMGVVYEAYQASLKRHVALKLLAPELARDPAFKERFRREGVGQAALDHPHIVPVYEAGETAEGLFLAMRLIRGRDLKQLIRSGALAAVDALQLLAPVAAALDSAHARGLIHRDVKPHNILIGEHQHPFLTDFGLTKTSEDLTLTRTGQFVGTVAYIAPEQISGEATSSSDIYSLGAVLYECLTGSVPFPRQLPAAVMFAHLNEPPPRVSDRRPDLPHELDGVVARGLAKDPAERPQLAAQLIDDAVEALRAATSVSPTRTGVRPRPTRSSADEQRLATVEVRVEPDLAAGRHPGSRPSNGSGARRAPSGALGDRTLPAPPNRTIGREHDLAAVGERLGTASVRLLTLTGPGGVGKTRLALEAARAVDANFADGACFVSLAAVQRPEDVPAAIVSALGVILLAGESPSQAAERFLAAKHLLLVADDFEHVLGAAPFIGALLGACPALTVLATSREPLALHAEERYPVPPLSLPELGTLEDTETLAGDDAVTLFVERARAHDPAFDLSGGNAAAVAEICRRVDGLPLAIELAAARCGLLTPAEIAERLDVALGTPGAAARDAPARHHTLRATVDWSYQLLSDGEKACFARFALFAGGATVDAAQAITSSDLDTLDHLVGKSLLVRRRQAHTPTRLQMLETLRAYAAERFAAADDRDAVHERHYRYFLALAKRHGSDQLLFGVEGREHLSRLDQEIHNFDAALRWAVGRPDAGPALAMVAALGWYWDLRERYAADAVDWIDRALALPGVEDHPAEQARALLAKPFLRRGEGRRDRPRRPRSGALEVRGRVAEGPAILAEAQAVARALGDPLLLAKVLNGCSAWWSIAGRSDAADTLADEALRCATEANDDWEIAQAWAKKAAAVSDLPELRERVERATQLLEDVGNVERLGQLFCNAAYNALIMGGDRDAREFADRAAPIVRDLHNAGTWMDLCGTTGLAAVLTGDTDAARDAFREELELCRQLTALPNVSEGLLGLAAVAVVDGDLSHAARLRGAAAAHSYGQQQDDVEARLEAAFFATARTRHGDDAWEAAVREGTQLTLGDAIASALDQ